LRELSQKAGRQKAALSGTPFCAMVTLYATEL
jgi:hypothetical protein